MVITFILSAVVIGVLDGIWLNVNAPMYQKMYSGIQKSPFKVNWIGAVIAYLAIFVLITFITVPHVENAGGSFVSSVYFAGFLGILIYAIYNFTNLAVFREYSWRVSLVDTLWGGVLFTLATYSIIKLKKYINL